jgi:hypothetical protein
MLYRLSPVSVRALSSPVHLSFQPSPQGDQLGRMPHQLMQPRSPGLTILVAR